MWTQTNERFLDRRGCGDELALDASLKAAEWLAQLAGYELRDSSDEELDAEGSDASHH
jgi:hypothetical protein